MKILITGICGFVGSTIARSIVEAGWASQIVGIDNFCRAGSETNRQKVRNLGVHLIAGDIRNASDLDSLPPCDWVIDAAAMPSVLAGVDGKTSSRQLVEHNLQGTINILEYCKTHQAGLILLSTSRVYSIEPISSLKMTVINEAFKPTLDQDFPIGITDKGISEQCSTTPPVSLYGSTKVASEHLAMEYGQTFNFPVWINRCGVMAGAGQFGHPAQGIYSYWIHAHLRRRPLKYIGFDGLGHQVRDCLHPKDIVPLIAKQIEFASDSKNIPRIVNLSGGVKSATSLRELSNWCDAQFGSHPVSSDPIPRKFDLPWVVLDTTLSEKHWDWNPTTTKLEIFQEIASHAQSNPNWLDLSS